MACVNIEQIILRLTELKMNLEMELTPPIIQGETYMGLEPEMKSMLTRYNRNMDLEMDPKMVLTSQN